MFDDAVPPPSRSSYTLHPVTADLRVEVVVPLRDREPFGAIEWALCALLVPEDVAEPDEAPAPGPEPRTSVDEVGADPTAGRPTDNTPDAATGATADTTTDAAADRIEPTADPTPDAITEPGSDPLEHARELRGLSLALALDPLDTDELGEAALVDAVELWSAVVSFAEARRGRAAASLERKIEEKYGAAGNLHRDSRGNRLPVAATELCMRLGMSRPAAGVIVRTGVLLEGQLCATGQALERGEIDQRKAEIIAAALDGKAFPLTAAVEDEVLPRAGRRTHRQLQNDLTDALLRLDPHGTHQRHQAAKARRCVTHPRPLPDGMVGTYLVAPAADGVALDLALDSAARSLRAAGDKRTIDQLRADLLTGVGTDALRTGWFGQIPVQPALPLPAPGRSADPSAMAADDGASVPEDDTDLGALDGVASLPTGVRLAAVGGVPVQINVTVPLSTLLGGDEPADLDGHGPIDAVTARALALGGTWRRLVTDPLSGVVLDVGRRRYRVPADLARIVRARDRTCFRPGCSARAGGCQLDHNRPFSQGGSTALTNLGPGCEIDHELKTLGYFWVRQRPGGIFEWISRTTGHTYRREVDGTTTYLGWVTDTSDPDAVPVPPGRVRYDDPPPY